MSGAQVEMREVLGGFGQGGSRRERLAIGLFRRFRLAQPLVADALVVGGVGLLGVGDYDFTEQPRGLLVVVGARRGGRLVELAAQIGGERGGRGDHLGRRWDDRCSGGIHRWLGRGRCRGQARCGCWGSRGVLMLLRFGRRPRARSGHQESEECRASIHLVLPPTLACWAAGGAKPWLAARGSGESTSKANCSRPSL